MTEPNIVINGQSLTLAQAMAVRVAVSSFHTEMADPDALGDDVHGKHMTAAYRARLTEVLIAMAANSPQEITDPIYRDAFDQPSDIEPFGDLGAVSGVKEHD